jgi:hypothetical protein
MAEMSNYCKAYLAKQLREYEGFTPDLSALRPETKDEGGQEVQIPRTALDDEDIVYLHDSYIVTDGVFNDENVLFSTVTDDWKRFCHEKLDFEVPVYEPIEIQVAEPAGEAPAESGGAPAS